MSFRKLVLVVALVLFTCMSGALSPVPALAQSSEAGVKSEVSPPIRSSHPTPRHLAL